MDGLIEIGGVAHIVEFRFGEGPVCGVQAAATGPIRAMAGTARGIWVSCSGEVVVGAGVGSAGEAASGASRVTIRVAVQYTADAMPLPYGVSTCSKE